MRDLEIPHNNIALPVDLQPDSAQMRLRPDTEQSLVRADIDFRCAHELAGESDHPGHVVAQQCLQFAEGPGFDRVAERAAGPTLEEIAGRACARSVTCVPAS